MENIKFIYADTQRTFDTEDTIRLDTHGTKMDLEKYGIVFEESKNYWFYRDDMENDPLIFTAKVSFNPQLGVWTGKIDSSTLTHLSKSTFGKTYSSEYVEGK